MIKHLNTVNIAKKPLNNMVNIEKPTFTSLKKKFTKEINLFLVFKI